MILLKRAPDYAPLLDFLRPLMLDRERVVQPGSPPRAGLLPARRLEAAQPAPVEAFLIESKDSAPLLIFQYATE